MTTAGQWLVMIALILGLIGPTPTPGSPPQPQSVNQAPAFQSTSIHLTSPSSCPASGCAPGQRLNLRFEFELGQYSPSVAAPDPNVKVCLYAPTDWVDQPTVSISQTGGVTGLSYTPADTCAEDTAQPAGYQLIAAAQTNIGADVNAFGDSLNLAFRLVNSASATGRVLARLFEQDGTAWTRSQQGFTTNINMAAPAQTVYTAASADPCDAGAYAPCYLNSADDLPGGIGAGLKDAADALAPDGTIIVLGAYSVKSKTVVIQQPLLISGRGTATLTYSGSTCTDPLIRLTNGGELRGLFINDGSGCSNTNRSLIEVNSPAPVLIQFNQLNSGDNAILVQDNSGPVTVRYNHIEGNAGHALYWASGSGTAPLNMVANNILHNGMSVECAADQTTPLPYRKANHNYWGSPDAPPQDSTHCAIQPGKQLGAPIQPRDGRSGVQASLVNVTADKQYAYDDQLAYQRTGGDADFNLYLVNHGFSSGNSVPFTLNLGGSPSPCSNYWDVFLPDGVLPNSTLELFFKYTQSQACITAINSSQYCDQTSAPARYPLWWYDPASEVTDMWDTTGQNPAGTNAGGGSGQTTTCHMDDNEIQVSIDSEGRPNLANDLSYLPFFVGIQVIKTFHVAASSNVITVNWTTNNEPDIDGFYIQRGMDRNNLSPITDLVIRKGSALSGSTYQFVDSDRTIGNTYYYRLQIVRSDGYVVYSDILSTEATSATATITPTPGPTATRTRTPGPSPTYTIPPPTRTTIPTRVPTRVPTRIPSYTPTLRAATPTRVSLTLLSPTRTRTSLANLTPGASGEGYPVPAEGATSTSAPQGGPTLDGYPVGSGTESGYPAPAVSQQPSVTPGGGTAIAMVGSVTPTGLAPVDEDTGSSGGAPRGSFSLLLGVLSGSMVMLGLGALWFFYLRKNPPHHKTP